MKIDLNEVPFSRRNSYMVISELNQKYSVNKVDAGLYLRTVRGSAERSMIAKLTPTFNGVPAPYDTELEFSSLVLTSGSFRIEICYEDENTLLFRGGPGTGMKIDFLTEEYKNDYIYDIVQKSYTLYMANCYKNNCRYLIWALRDKISLDQKWNDNVAEYSRLEVKSSGAGFVFALQEVETEWDGKIRKFDFGLCRNETHTDFLQFLESMPAYDLKYRNTIFKVAYLHWSSMIAKDKFLPRDAMLVSKNWLTDKTGPGNLGYNALALSFKDKKRAWDQFALMFDMMDKSGRIPDSLNDSYVKWNHVKPPMQGWFLSKMMEHMELKQEQLTEAYLVLQRSTKWWLRFRNFRGEGLYCYDHAKDSGWDNASVFSVFPPVSTPELQAFLILQMDVIADISNRLGIEGDAKYWKQQSDKLLSTLLEKGFKNNLPVSVQNNTGEIIENGSILPYLVLLLGERLPEKIRKASVAELKKFVTPYGIATERPDSRFYDSTRKFRGPIWAPATYLALEALKACGEVEFAKEQAQRFLDLVEEKGLAENYDALTGEPTGPSIYTWTASAYLLIMNL